MKRKGWSEHQDGETALELCHKHGTDPETRDGRDGARAFERGHRCILDMVNQPQALDNLPKHKKIHFAQKIEFEEKWKRSEIKSIWDYYKTKDEVLKEGKA